MLDNEKLYEGKTIQEYITYLDVNYGVIRKSINPIEIALNFGCEVDDVLKVLKDMGYSFTKSYEAEQIGLKQYKEIGEARYFVIRKHHQKGDEVDPKSWARWMGRLGIITENSNISIGHLDTHYIEINEIQDKNDELKKIERFLNKYVEKYVQKTNIDKRNIEVEFINYGKTELVYVLNLPNNEKITLLVKQPSVKFGQVKQEAMYLSELKNKDNMVVAPIDYFEYGDYELYATPYINQTRCVASLTSWGMYVPEPYYRFVPFNEEQEKVVTSCMISKLVSLYDFDNNEGICECKLGGGDFMLPKGWELEPPTIENTLPNLYLIAAREKINCSFEDYLDLIREEFSKTTINKNQNDLFINKRARVPMSLEDIEAGIELGKKNIKAKLESRLVKSLSKK